MYLPRALVAPDEATGEQPAVHARLDIPARTILKVVVAIVALWLLVRLSSVLLELVCALLLTAALDPLVTRLEERGWTRTRAVGVILVLLIGLTAGVLALTIPPLVRQGTQLATDLPSYLDRSQPYFRDHPKLYAQLHQYVDARSGNPGQYFSHIPDIGLRVVGFVTKALLVVTMTAYLLIADGERTLFRLFNYLPPGQRAKIRRVLPEVSRVVSGYMVGQVITSALFAVFAFAVCFALGVPQPLLLALIAGLADAIPIVGAVLATVPAALLALTVSPTAAIMVVVVYAIYQQFENHVIIPRVYQRTLAISAFGVLVAVAVGAQLLGIVGALIALPIAAAIPVIEATWREEPPPAPRPEEIGLGPAPWAADDRPSPAAGVSSRLP